MVLWHWYCSKADSGAVSLVLVRFSVLGAAAVSVGTDTGGAAGGVDDTVTAGAVSGGTVAVVERWCCVLKAVVAMVLLLALGVPRGALSNWTCSGRRVGGSEGV